MPERDKSILFVLEGFFPYQKAGTEVYVLQLAKYLLEKGYEVSVLISRSEEVSDYVFEEIPVFTFKIPEKPIAEELNGLIPPRGIEAFLQKVSDIGPDLVHFHSLGRAINSYQIKAVKELGYKTVFTAHLGSNICIKGDFKKFNEEICSGEVIPVTCLACQMHARGAGKNMARWASKLIHLGTRLNKKSLPSSFYQAMHRKNELQRVKKYSDVIIAISEWIEEAFDVNDIRDNVFLVKQGIDKDFVNRGKVDKTRNTDHPVKIGFIGRMHPHKGFHLLKDAFDQIGKDKWELKIATLPSKDETAYYKKMLDWSSGKTNVQWKENQSREEIINLLDELDVLVLPSVSNEMAPLIILEAFARKVPVIGSSYPAIVDMVQNNNGVIFENGSVSDLKSKLIYILDDPQVLPQWSKNITPPRTFEDVGRDMIKIYDFILK